MKKIKRSTKIFFASALIISFCILMVTGPFESGLFADSPKIKVFLDPGHGGRDPGAIGFGYFEKTANLDIALRVKSKLEAGGFAVIMRRTDDSYKTLDEIVNMANSSGADIFVSIHIKMKPLVISIKMPCLIADINSKKIKERSTDPSYYYWLKSIYK